MAHLKKKCIKNIYLFELNVYEQYRSNYYSFTRKDYNLEKIAHWNWNQRYWIPWNRHTWRYFITFHIQLRQPPPLLPSLPPQPIIINGVKVYISVNSWNSQRGHLRLILKPYTKFQPPSSIWRGGANWKNYKNLLGSRFFGVVRGTMKLTSRKSKSPKWTFRITTKSAILNFNSTVQFGQEICNAQIRKI